MRSLTGVVGFNRLLGSIAVLALATACPPGTGTTPGTDGGTTPPTEKKLTSVALTPATASIVSGTKTKLAATATFSDNTTLDLSALAKWSSSDDKVATVAGGEVTGVSAGTANITASDATSGVKGTSTITVTAAKVTKIGLSPATVSLANGTSLQLTATATFDNQTTQDISKTANWASKDPTIATAVGGLVVALKVGSTTVIAMDEASKVTESVTVTVTAATLKTLSVDPPTPSLAKGATQAFTAMGIFSDKTNQDLTKTVAWTATPATVATIDATGKLTAVGEGTATVTATDKASGVTGTARVTVTAAILASIGVTPAAAIIPNGLTQNYTATGTYSDATSKDITKDVTWASSDAKVAIINNADTAADPKGKATGKAEGVTKITATLGKVVSPEVPLTVTKAVLVKIAVEPGTFSVPKGVPHQFMANGTFSDGTILNITGAPAVTWASSNTAVGKVSNAISSTDPKGRVTTLGTGTTTISAVHSGFPTVLAGNATLTVTAARVRGLAIAPISALVPKGMTQQFTAVAIFTDDSKTDVTADSNLTWGSDNPLVAEISNAAGTKGLATAKGLNPLLKTARITATYNDAGSPPKPHNADTTLTVTPAVVASVSVSPSSHTTPNGVPVRFRANAAMSDGTNRDVSDEATWTSSDPAVAPVANASGGPKGEVRPLAVGGPVTITATIPMFTTTGKPVSATGTVTVTAAVVVDFFVTPRDVVIAKGTSRQYQAVGAFTDGTAANITENASWSINCTTFGSAGLASISNTAGTKGYVTTSSSHALNRADCDVVATANAGKNQTPTTRKTRLIIQPPVISQINVAPAAPTLTTNALPTQFHAFGIFTDGSQREITKDRIVDWTSSATSVATVGNDNNTPVTKGVVKVVGVGTTDIKATIDLGGGKSIVGATTLAVSSAILSKLNVEPINPTVIAGAHFRAFASGIYNDNTRRNLTLEAAWASDNTSVAKVTVATDTSGAAVVVHIDAVAAGTAKMTATYGGVTGTTLVTVKAPVLDAISISPVNSAIPAGTTQQFTATGYYSDRTTQDLTSVATWTSTQTAIATIASGGVATGLTKGATIIRASYGNKTSNDAALGVTRALLNSLAVNPSSASFAKGTRLRFTATGNFSDGSVRDLTGAVLWTTSDSTVATVDLVGVAFGNAAGSAKITATEPQSGVAATATVTVTAATLDGIVLDRWGATIASGTSRQFQATGIYSDKSTSDLTSVATWAVGDTAIATVSNSADSAGLVTGVAKGATTLTAAYGGKTSPAATLGITAAVLESLSISPTAPSIAKGTWQAFRAVGTYSDKTTLDLTDRVTWTTSSSAVATITSIPDATFGRAYGFGVGAATITATASWKLTVTASTTLTVTSATLKAVHINPRLAAVPAGNTLQFSATGVYSDNSTRNLTDEVQWVSGDSAIATISSATGSAGLAAGVVAGGPTTIGASFAVDSSTTITATSAALTVTAATLSSIAVTPTTLTLPKGTVQRLSAMGTFSDKSTRDLTGVVTWTVDKSSIATVTNGGASLGGGKVYAVDVGTATVTATMPDPKRTTPLSATAAITVSSATLNKIAVFPIARAIAKGTTLQMQAVGGYSDGTTKDLTGTLTWSSSAETVATVSNGAEDVGLVTGVAEGTGTITATDSTTSVAGAAAVKITAATLKSLSVSPATPSIPKGTRAQFQATGTYTDGSTRDLTFIVSWDTSDATVATISNAADSAGRAHGAGQGTATITATFPSATTKISGTATLTVSAATLKAVVVAPPSPSIAAGTTRQFSATGVYSDATTQDLTASVTWASDNTAAATISNASDSAGLATGVAKGAAGITATYVVDSTTTVASRTVTLDVRQATLTSIAVNPGTTFTAKGTREWFTATGTYSDGRVQDITYAVGWTSSSPTVATVTGGGMAFGIEKGATTIYATHVTAAGTKVQGSASLTVTAATLHHLIIEPIVGAVPAGVTRQYRAVGVYSDASARDLTAEVSWTTGSSSVATVDTSGVVSGIAKGTTTVTATFEDTSVDSSKWVTATVPLTVTAAVLQKINVSPTGATIAKGGRWHFSATGGYSDGTTRDLTPVVSWTSSDLTIASVGDFAGTSGWAFGVDKGSVTITASLLAASGVVSGTASLTVTAATLKKLAVFPALWSIPSGTNLQFDATGIYSDGTTSDLTQEVTWSTDTATFATISSAEGTMGLATGVAEGTAKVTATITDSVSGQTLTQSSTLNVRKPTLTKISVDPPTPTLAAGTLRRLRAIGTFSDSTTVDITDWVAWDSSDLTIASVARGVVYGVKASSTAVSISASRVKADGTKVAGTASLTVTAATLNRILVNPVARTIAKGTVLQFAAHGVFSDASVLDMTESVTWASSNEAVATISNAEESNGLATAVAKGTATITATDSASGVASASVGLAVTDPTLSKLAVTPATSTIAKGTVVQLTATGTYSDSSTQDLTDSVAWTSSDPTIVTGTRNWGYGLAWGAGQGSATVTATFPGNGVQGTATVTVTAATLKSIAVTPVAKKIAAGTSHAMKATGTYSDATTQDLTALVSWSSSNEATATISNGPETYGVAYGVAMSATAVTLTATLADAVAGTTTSGSTTLTISAAKIATVAITPADPSITLTTTRTQQFTATATFTDSTTQDITNWAIWESDNSAVAYVWSGWRWGGLATGVAAGSAVIKCTVPMTAITHQTTLTVK